MISKIFNKAAVIFLIITVGFIILDIVFRRSSFNYILIILTFFPLILLFINIFEQLEKYLIFRILYIKIKEVLLITIPALILSLLFVFNGLKWLMQYSDFLNIINISSAISLSISAICFSWARNLEEKNKDFITVCGEKFIMSSIFILIYSALRFSERELKEFILKYPTFIQNEVLKVFLKICYFLLCGLLIIRGLWIGFTTILEIITFIYRKHYDKY